MISINTYHLACAEGSALQCCSFFCALIVNIGLFIQLLQKLCLVTHPEWACLLCAGEHSQHQSAV